MKKFKAYRIHSRQGQICSRFENLTLKQLTPGDVIIKSVYSNINYKDALAATGKGTILKKFPLVGGVDVAGIVESSDDERFITGEQVLVCGAGLSETMDGGYAEYVRIPGDFVIQLPDGLSLFQAIAIGTAGFTAALAINQMQLNGQTPDKGPVAVTGATGGVGSFAIDMLSGLSYEVAAISGKQDQIAYLESLGASKVLSRQDLSMGSRPLEKSLWAGAIDCVGGELLSWLTRTVQPKGNIAVIGLTGGITLNTTVMPFILRGINLLGINSVFCPYTLKNKIWQRLASELKPQHLDKIVTAIIPFEQLPEMFEAYIQGKVTGRTVVNIAN
jgi:NADPH2:quinone reductase